MRIGGHWFYNGHASVTKYIKSFLEAEGLIDPKPLAEF
jgi:hypothetical protein